MRILMLHNRYLERGGEDTSFQMEAELLRSNGCEVVTYEENNTRVQEIGRARTALGSIWSPYSYRKVRDILRSDHFDVMHVQNFFPLISPSAYYAAAHEGVAVVQSLRNFRLTCLPGTLSRNGGVCEDCVGKAVPWPGVVHGCYRGSVVGSFAVASMVANTGPAPCVLTRPRTEHSPEALWKRSVATEPVALPANSLTSLTAKRRSRRVGWAAIHDTFRPAAIGDPCGTSAPLSTSRV